MCVNSKELHNYRLLNRFARKNSVVILGSTYAQEMPVGELKQIFGILSDIYNRSLSELSVFEAKEIAEEIITELMPKKIVLQLGETDLDNGSDVDAVISEISSIISKIKKMDKSTEIILVSLNNLNDKLLEADFNTKLEKTASKTNCTFVDISSASGDDPSRINAFRILRYFLSDDLTLQII